MNAWTDEEVALLRKLASEGEPARVIATHLPKHTKNSVIGKAHRLGISLMGNRRPQSKPAGEVQSTPPVAKVKRPPQKVNRYVPPVPAKVFEFKPKPSPTSESPHVAWADHEEWMCNCMYDDKTWCSGQKATVRIGHRTGLSNWCEFHRKVFTIERKVR